MRFVQFSGILKFPSDRQKALYQSVLPDSDAPGAGSCTAHFLRGVPHWIAGILTSILQRNCKRPHIIQNPEPFQGHADSPNGSGFLFYIIVPCKPVFN